MSDLDKVASDTGGEFCYVAQGFEGEIFTPDLALAGELKSWADQRPWRWEWVFKHGGLFPA